MGDTTPENTPSVRPEFLAVLKKLEPIGLLITASLAIATLRMTSGINDRAYEFAVISSILFIFSFILGIAKHYSEIYKYNKIAYPSFLFLHIFMNFSFYCVFFFGILFLLLYSFELVKSNPIIISILQNMPTFFIFAGTLWVLYYMIKNREYKKDNKYKVIDVVSQIVVILFSLLAFVKIYDIVNGKTNYFEFFLINIFLIGGFVFIGVLILQLVLNLYYASKMKPGKYKRFLQVTTSLGLIGIFLIFFIATLIEYNIDLFKMVQTLYNNLIGLFQ